MDGEWIMEMKEILDKLQQIFRDVFENEQLVITADTCQEDIVDWDSLMHITILEVVMDEFDINFTLDEMIELIDVKSMTEAIKRKKEEQ